MHRDGRRSRSWHADVAQLVAHHLAKVRVAGSNPVIRSKVRIGINPQRWSGRVVRQRPAKPCTRVRFPSPPPSSNPSAISSAGERFPDTEEVTGSIPVSRTSIAVAQCIDLQPITQVGRDPPTYPGMSSLARLGTCWHRSGDWLRGDGDPAIPSADAGPRGVLMQERRANNKFSAP